MTCTAWSYSGCLRTTCLNMDIKRMIQQAAVNFRNCVNRFAFALEARGRSSYCEVGTETVYITYRHFRSRRPCHSLAVRRLSLAGDRFLAMPCKHCGGKSDPGTGFAPGTSIFLSLPTPLMLQTHFHLIISMIWRTSRRSMRHLKESNAFGYWRTVDRKLLSGCVCVRACVWLKLVTSSLIVSGLLFSRYVPNHP